jgi:hypothetical protein
MEFLNKILARNQLDSVEKIRKYIARPENDIFEVLTKENLKLDGESRIYEERIEYRNKVFDVSFLRIANAKEVRFVNCIFLGKLLISQNHNDSCEIYIDYCIFIKELKITGIENSKSICLVSVNAPRIRIENNYVNSISCDSCSVVKFVVLDNQADEFRTFQCNISYPLISRNSFVSVSFPYKQIDIKKQKLFRKGEQCEKDVQAFNCFLYDSKKLDFDSLSNSEKQQINIDTLRFMLEQSDINAYSTVKSHIRYLEAVESHESFFGKIVLCIFGALLKPARVFFVILAVLLIFGFAYQIPSLLFNAPGEKCLVLRNLTFIEAIYYSGIKFTTVGYGDISPTGIARIVAIIEGLIGILLSGAFLTSLIRKYTE